MIQDHLPIGLTLCSAFLFALGGQLQSRGLAGGTDSRTGTALSITSAACCYWLVAPVFLDPANFLHAATVIFVLVGVFRPSLSAICPWPALSYWGRPCRLA